MFIGRPTRAEPRRPALCKTGQRVGASMTRLQSRVGLVIFSAAVARSSNGRTADSGSAYGGSNPPRATKRIGTTGRRRFRWRCFWPAPSSSGLGRCPLKAETRVRLPLGLPTIDPPPGWGGGFFCGAPVMGAGTVARIVAEEMLLAPAQIRRKSHNLATVGASPTIPQPSALRSATCAGASRPAWPNPPENPIAGIRRPVRLAGTGRFQSGLGPRGGQVRPRKLLSGGRLSPFRLAPPRLRRA